MGKAEPGRDVFAAAPAKEMTKSEGQPAPAPAKEEEKEERVISEVNTVTVQTTTAAALPVEQGSSSVAASSESGSETNKAEGQVAGGSEGPLGEEAVAARVAQELFPDARGKV